MSITRKDKAREHVTLLIGNPGTGRSTLLNSLTRGVHFKGGVAVGRGLPQALQMCERTPEEDDQKQDTHDWFGTITGLDDNDIEIRKKSTAEIQDALQRGVELTICFVVTLEAGSVRQTDLSTMQLVLGSIQGAHVKYGVIINKLEEKEYKWIEEPEHMKEICKQLELKSNCIFLCKYDPDLHFDVVEPKFEDEHDTSNIIPPKIEEFEKFLSSLTRIVIPQKKMRPHITLLVGNPGTGKSSLLNILTGGANFKSGVSLGRGVTQVLQIHKHTALEWYADTPGFDDVKIRKQAAAAIQEALTQGARYTICFVVTLEAGRLRPSDLSTMQLILDSIELPSVKYGIIVNKLEEEVYELLHDEQNVKIFCAQLNLQGKEGKNGKRKYFTNHIFACKHDKTLFGKSNNSQKERPRNELLEKFLSMISCNEIEEDEVEKIEYEKIEEMSRLFAEQTQKLMKDNEFLKEQLNEFARKSREYESKLSELEKENKDLLHRFLGLPKGAWDSIGSEFNSMLGSFNKRSSLAPQKSSTTNTDSSSSDSWCTIS